MMIHVLSNIRVQPRQPERFLELFKAIIPNVFTEQGCIEYTPVVDKDAHLPPHAIDQSHHY